jgi:predicted acyl esterase
MLKEKKNDFKEKTPRVQYYTMGSNKWQNSEVWPPENVEMIPFYLSSDGNANTLYGDGKLTTPEKKN